MNSHIFFLGGHDAEMLEIRNILRQNGKQFFDKGLSWGASLSSYKAETENLPDNVVPVFVELKPESPYPENAIFVDHHDEKAGKNQKTSIEQIADLLSIRLNRHQQLVSANDKGHIREMRRLSATDEEISEIRALDRKAQGVTDTDERDAEESVQNRLEILGDDTAMIDSLTDKTSPVFDRIYDQYQHIFVFTPDGQMSYSGKGEMVDCLVRVYKEKQQRNPCVNFWWGGNLPEDGYFGTDAPMIVDELRQMIRTTSI